LFEGDRGCGVVAVVFARLVYDGFIDCRKTGVVEFESASNKELPFTGAESREFGSSPTRSVFGFDDEDFHGALAAF